MSAFAFERRRGGKIYIPCKERDTLGSGRVERGWYVGAEGAYARFVGHGGSKGREGGRRTCGGESEQIVGRISKTATRSFGAGNKVGDLSAIYVRVRKLARCQCPMVGRSNRNESLCAIFRLLLAAARYRS